MNILKVCLNIITISFCHYIYIKSYSIIYKVKLRNFSIKDLLITFLITISVYYNTFYNYNFSKIIISFILLFCFFKTIFRENLRTTFIKTLFFYLLGWIIESILGAFTFFVFINSIQEFDTNIFFKTEFSILMMLIYYLLCNLKSFQKFTKKINEYMKSTFNLTLTIFFSIIVLVILTFYIIISKETISYISGLILIATFFFLFSILISQIINAKKADEKQEILLSFMRKYETIIDNERIARHEMFNNLLTLKSIRDKNSKGYNKVLDEIISYYKADKTYNRLYDLPSGLKGIFYYKIYDMQENGIEPYIDISNKVIKKLEELNVKVLAKISKILGILLDNAKEGAEESEKKLVMIEVYEDGDEIIIYIENTISKEIQNLDVRNLKEKGFSTKGKKRGYGLYLINNILNKTKKISLEQKIENNKFCSVLKIK